MSPTHPVAAPISARAPAQATRALCLTAALFGAALFATQAQAGRIVINHDEWTLSDQGYTNAGGSNADNFAQNLIGFLDGNAAGGSVLIYADNFGLTGNRLQTSLAHAGYSATVNIGIGFDLATLQGYDAVFLGGSGHAKDDSVLTDYVNGGGGVYIAAGTGIGGAAGEAARWNGFLSGFGLGFGNSYNGFEGTIAPGSDHLLFTGVDHLYFWNGNSVSADADVPGAGIRMSSAVGIGMIGVYASDPSAPPPTGEPTPGGGDPTPGGGDPTPGEGDPPPAAIAVPLPGTLALLAVGLAGVARRRRASSGRLGD